MINILREPASPLTLFNYSDILILGIMILFTILSVKKNLLKEKIILNILLILYIIVIPLISSNIESHNVYYKFEIVDSFNLIYIIFKWPVWWVIGILNIIFMYLLLFKKKKKQ